MHLKSIQKEVFLLGSEGDTQLLIVSSVPSLSPLLEGRDSGLARTCRVFDGEGEEGIVLIHQGIALHARAYIHGAVGVLLPGSNLH